MEKYNVLCVNCNTFIEVDLIEEHSLKCLSYSSHENITKESDPSQEINLRLIEFENSLKSSSKIFGSSQKIFDFFGKVIHKLLKIDRSHFNIKKKILKMQKFSEILSEISSITTSLHIILYCERLKILISDKLMLFGQETKKFQQQSKNLTLNGLKTENFSAENSEKPKKHLRGESGDVSNDEKLQINSILEEFSLKSFIVSEEEDSEIELAGMNHAVNFCEQDWNETLENLFYSQCMILKLDYHSSHPVQKDDERTLFQLCKSKGIKPEEWEKFIKSHYNNL